MSNAQSSDTSVYGLPADLLLEALLDGTSDAILLFDESGRLSRANARALSLLGYAPGDLSSLRFAELVMTSTAGDLSLHDSAAAPARVLLRAKDGQTLALSCSVRRVEWSPTPLFLCIGQAGATPEAGARQGSSHGAAEPPPGTGASSGNGPLHTAPAEKTPGTGVSAERAQAQAAFAGAIGHELRTPLTVLMGFLEIALSGWPAGAEERRQAQLLKARQAAIHMQNILEDMLLLARLDASAMPVETETVALAPVAREAAVALRAAYPGQHVHVRGTAGIMVRADHGLLLQVLSNLLDNAAKYSPEGCAVRLEAEMLGEAVAIRVVDQGVGIAAADLPRLFQRFTRLNETARAGRGGTGLGLSICRSLVEAMGGTIGVDSVLGLGSTFTVRLPGARRSAAAIVDGYDPLTNLPSRATMQAMIADEIERGRLHGRFVAIVSLDVIHFGQFNIAHGHRSGDEALRRIAELLRGALRGQDHLGRDGADSFLALLPGADAAEAAAVMERLRLAVEGATLTIGAAALRLRLTAGRAVYPTDAPDARSLILHAESTRGQASVMARQAAEPVIDGADLPAHFALAVSHELRTPLTTILGSAEVLLHGWARLDDAARRKGVERLLSGARRLDLLVRDLLLVVGLEKGHLTVSPLPTGLTPLLEQAIYDASAAHPNLELRARGLRGAPAVRADPDRVIQVLMHLIDNAARHGQGAGPPELRVEVRPHEVEIRVTDRGPGLPAEGRSRLFTRFGKLSQNAHAGRVGTGLGLYISRLLVEAMGGAIGVESLPGKGASFWFTLPRAEAGMSDERP